MLNGLSLMKTLRTVQDLCALPLGSERKTYATRVHRNWRNHIINRHWPAFVGHLDQVHLVVPSQFRHRERTCRSFPRNIGRVLQPGCSRSFRHNRDRCEAFSCARCSFGIAFRSRSSGYQPCLSAHTAKQFLRHMVEHGLLTRVSEALDEVLHRITVES